MVDKTALYVVVCLLCGGLVCIDISGYVAKFVRITTYNAEACQPLRSIRM
jgi:hypothetical protein